MYFIYVLQSLKTYSFYIGHCENLMVRIAEHNRGKTKSTKYKIPWVIIYFETFETKLEANHRELEIKSYKGGNSFKNLIKVYRIDRAPR